MEAWYAEPPAPGEPWGETGQVTYLSHAGIVELCGPMRGPSGQRLLLGPPFFAYGLRAENDFVEVRAATEAEAGRVIAVERRRD
ncbi:hypothetical protein [Planobispora takensis]|uniref:Uncharacterized protein n=1 Tax=Planobispora takensis TaxID=1367882 RepID=A0A8J3SVS8_9ACTN|nr:hypothetical protein [Planobispora takensis]GII00561.1 hypothetical protein Pta02_25690 [Planobispora takensis]